MQSLVRWVPALWSLLLAALLLGPALGPGYVLSYDMVWVPDLPVRPDAWGVGSALPRAVPSDLVVAVVDEVVPAMALQKLVLLGCLVGAGTGAAALVDRLPLFPRLVAVSVAVWNPFVVERLAIGHWPVLAGYAALPWLLLAGMKSRQTGRMPARLGPLMVLGSLSASAGVVSAAALLLGGGRSRLAPHLILVAAANAPWMVTGALHAGAATSDPDGAQAFATAGEGFLAAPLTALSLGGIWNAEVVPTSRTGLLAVAWLVLLLWGAAAGARPWWGVARATPGARPVLLGCWGLGLGVALLSWLAPTVVGSVAAHIPGGGLLRDGSRLLGLCVPLLATLAAHAADGVARRLPDAVSGAVVAGSFALLPLTLMPDAAWGVGGRLVATPIPPAYAEIGALADRAPPGDVVVLPFSSYRAPGWLGGRKVLDPLPRLVTRDVVSDDVLHVDGKAIAGEDPRAAAVRSALGQPGPGARARALGRLGIGVVVADGNIAGQQPPEVAGETLSSRGGLRVVVPASAVDRRSLPAGWSVSAGGAWLFWAGALVAGPLLRAGQWIRHRQISTARSSRW